MHRVRSLVPVLLGAALLLAACSSAAGEGDGDASEPGALHVVATTPLIAEFAQHVVGDDAEVESLIPLGADLHSWQPPTSVARTIAQADVLLVNGYNLEASLLDVVTENAPRGVPLVVASAGLEPLEGGHDHGDDEDHDHEEGEDHEGDEDHEAGDLVYAEGDPHLWLSVPNAIAYVENIRDALVAADAEHAAGYEERASAFVEELQALDGEIHETLSAIPQGRRTIVAFHDAYQYLAHEYGLEVVASVAPANPNQETSAGAIADIVRQVEALGVPAVFKEPEFSAQSLELIAQESGARVLELYNTPTDDVPTYAEMMRANAAALVDGLAVDGGAG
ncbi:MAG: metal ABC transporter substrate-binding protein [Dehalococcoidia bacterium]|nr:metal ABC transporter substrate-binding protein [Dehalococcoidia bacterium]